LLASAAAGASPFFRSSALAQATAAKPLADDEVRRTSDEWFEALRQNDLNTINRLEADDFLTVQEAPSGVAVIEKATQMASLKKAKEGAVRFRRELSNVRIRRFGDAAILTAVAVFRRDVASDPSPTRAVITEVWIRDDNRWRIAHFATHPVRDRVRR
jgi:uncharacterized protein (TIGR02246 family)